jgi:hypothetical protein
MINVVQKRLCNADIYALKAEAARHISREIADAMADQVNLDEILYGTDMERRASELRKILILSGIDVDLDLADDNTVGII